MPSTAYLVIIPALLTAIVAQWRHSVIHSEFTCENIVYAYPSCLHSASCISDYFLECKCVPRVLKEMLELSGGPLDGHTLCLYATFTLEVGEPRCCEYYKREIILKEPEYRFELSEMGLPEVDTRSAEAPGTSSQLSREIDSLLPDTSLERLIDYGKELFDDINNDADDRANASLETNRSVSKRRSLRKRSKLIEALKCFPVDRSLAKEAGYEQINMDKQN